MTFARQKGLTLIELVTTMALTTVVIGFVAVFISGPVDAYMQTSGQAELLDATQTSIDRLARDIRAALPNSVRIATPGTTTAIELLETLDAGRYREVSDVGDELDFTAPDSEFTLLGQFSGIAKPFSSTQSYLAVYSAGVPGASAYDGSGVMTPPGTQIDIQVDGTADRVRLNPAVQFPFPSPRRRIYLVAGPVTWLCNPTTGTLRRYSGYSLDSDQSNRDSDAELIAAGATRQTISDRLRGCDLDYLAGTHARSGVVTVDFTIGRGTEQVAMVHQVQVPNAP